MLAVLMMLLSAPAVPAVPAAAAAAADTGRTVWQIDPAHSNIEFAIRHLVGRVHGTFRDWNGTVQVDSGKWDQGSVEVTIQAASIFTDNDTRDEDLRSAHFFEVAKYPTLHFKSTKVEATGEKLKIYGDLTIRDVTKPVELDGAFDGLMRSTDGDRIGFDASTTINRNDWGVTWNRMVEGGGLLLGDDVQISVSVEAVRK
jgi:polyisoprenoid-binding protein YceI